MKNKILKAITCIAGISIVLGVSAMDSKELFIPMALLIGGRNLGFALFSCQ